MDLPGADQKQIFFIGLNHTIYTKIENTQHFKTQHNIW